MLITSQNALERFCNTLKGAEFITVDTEFLREKTYYPKLCLIQIAGPGKNAAAIDTLAPGLDLSPVFTLLHDPAVLKVFHAGRQDLEIFFTLTGKVVSPLFDTQIASMVCGYGDQIGYESLVRDIAKANLDKSVQFTDWSRRPLSDRQIEYAVGDVVHLVDIYHHLRRELEKRGRTAWVFQEEEILLSPATYQNPPEDAWKRIKIKTPKPKTLAILRELAAWREREAQRKNLPRGWIFKDETLADMAAQAPQSAAELARIRGVSAEAASGRTGAALIEVIQSAASSPKDQWPAIPKRKILSPEASATADILKMLLKIQAALHDVAPRLIADGEDLELLAEHAAPDIPALKGWRRDVFGADALALKSGHIAIGLKNGKIEKFPLEKA